MSISTKNGDKGQTSLWSGERIDKCSLRVESYGTLDELDAHLGEAKHYANLEETKKLLDDIQKILPRIMGELASVQKKFTNPIDSTQVDYLTEKVYYFEEIIKLKGFVIPGNTIQSAKLDVCRTIARRAERRIIGLSKEYEVSSYIISFINRLSDLLYLMARYEEFKADAIKYL
ncbi:MAG: cob(I)yrinic acid a,c-diamide adenosyltransferase [Bacteroidales bacterium]|jgi:ATP:cob(I)alamin adenosyltransferase|nr:cob(I)yrinic acid a,c-diamide adenosyltransferase [Candidatus Cloacimonadota bacterium]MDD2388064.1 cob(I)yrinic acid a,c-diamide adenosyltransferase [Bacteroidales bacterium]MDD4156142.1 cob(I)yrinic acid a,c-diamide adenosyltransferase [Candidatus Cloacimonadota bacterium]